MWQPWLIFGTTAQSESKRVFRLNIKTFGLSLTLLCAMIPKSNGGTILKETLKEGPRLRPKTTGTQFRLEPELLKKIHDTMVKSRVLEERLIRMYKQSDGYFWIGGPGEEAFNVPLGHLVKKGHGLDYDFLHLHYRSGAIMTALGAEPIDALRQMNNTALDPYSGGRNFSNHFSKRAWNVVPVSSTIETQYATAIGDRKSTV
jgi:2-oxoisovalerate dehydrogenase E1 component alpha subunit